MKTILLSLIILLMGNQTFAQSAIYEKTLETFKANYNADNYEALFASFAPAMQTALPLEKATAFFGGLKAQAGKILKSEFTAFEKGTLASYKTTFERGVFALNMSLDGNAKINGLLLKPFVEKTVSAGNTVNALEPIPKEFSEAIFRHLNALPNKAQVSIAVIEGGKARFYGAIKEGNTLKYTDNKDKVFEIGSITKVFTATLLADAVVKGQLKLTDPINPYFGFPFKDNINIRFVDLANHTSGLERLPSNLDLEKVDPENPYKEYGKAALESYLKNDLKLMDKSGEKSEYSNLGAGLLGYTLGVVAKSDYTQLLKKTIFEKYKMTSSYTDNAQVKQVLVKGLDADGMETGNWDFEVLAGAGGILSTVVDLSKFVVAQFDASNAELALTRVPTFTINENRKVGLGWFIVKAGSGSDLYWHNGGTGGYSSSMAVDTKGKNGVVILSNVSSDLTAGSLDKLCFELMEKLAKE